MLNTPTNGMLREQDFFIHTMMDTWNFECDSESGQNRTKKCVSIDSWTNRIRMCRSWREVSSRKERRGSLRSARWLSLGIIECLPEENEESYRRRCAARPALVVSDWPGVVWYAELQRSQHWAQRFWVLLGFIPKRSWIWIFLIYHTISPILWAYVSSWVCSGSALWSWSLPIWQSVSNYIIVSFFLFLFISLQLFVKISMFRGKN